MDLISDKTGLPTDEFLEALRTWPIGTYSAMLADVSRAWQHSVDVQQRGTLYKFDTCGWSGNEDIIEAMRDNAEFWRTCWVQSRRGGKYVFEVMQGW